MIDDWIWFVKSSITPIFNILKEMSSKFHYFSQYCIYYTYRQSNYFSECVHFFNYFLFHLKNLFHLSFCTLYPSYLNICLRRRVCINPRSLNFMASNKNCARIRSCAKKYDQQKWQPNNQIFYCIKKVL